LAGHVIKIEADEAKCRHYFDRSPMIITALVPVIGYDRATDMVSDFNKEGRKNMRVFLEEKLGKELIDRIFSPYQLTALGFRHNGHDSERK
ncbi:MAG: hypothetical protein WCH07_10920, partial [Deltaproteobacteria bacterium]